MTGLRESDGGYEGGHGSDRARGGGKEKMGWLNGMASCMLKVEVRKSDGSKFGVRGQLGPSTGPQTMQGDRLGGGGVRAQEGVLGGAGEVHGGGGSSV